MINSLLRFLTSQWLSLSTSVFWAILPDDICSMSGHNNARIKLLRWFRLYHTPLCWVLIRTYLAVYPWRWNFNTSSLIASNLISCHFRGWYKLDWRLVLNGRLDLFFKLTRDEANLLILIFLMLSLILLRRQSSLI